LRAQADAQQGPRRRQPPFDQGQFGAQERIERIVEGADRAAQYDQQVGFHGIERGQVVDGGIHVAHQVAAFLQHGTQRAQVFEMDVADDDGGLVHGRLSDGGGARRFYLFRRGARIE